MKVYLTGGFGFLGGEVYKQLTEAGHEVRRYRGHDLDLRDLSGVVSSFLSSPPEVVIHCAGRVGGMLDNQDRPADYLTENTTIGLNVLEACKRAYIKRVINVGSSCMYPGLCYGPYEPSELWGGPPHPSNLGYGIAKRVVAEAFNLYKLQYKMDTATVVLPNLYGPKAESGRNGHFVASIARTIKEAKAGKLEEIQMFGTGEARRELIYVSDAARAVLFALDHHVNGLMNFGVGSEVSIEDVASTIKGLLGYTGTLSWGERTGDGQPRKIMDSSEAFSLGWKPKISLDEGLRMTVLGE